jgi:hypothetical protein
MSLSLLVDHAVNKQNFQTVDDYIRFCTRYLEFVETGLQARIISQNEIHYQFFQYKEDGSFNITRPLNSCLMYDAHNFEVAAQIFRQTLSEIRAAARPSDENRESVIRSIYTIQQTIGAALDALPSGMSNKARKINGDLFEKFICMLIASLGVDCVSGVVHVPVKDENGIELFKSQYQHDLLISNAGELKVIGSVKTSSKDRIDKVFIDKFLYSKLTDTTIPHIAIFLNDVQRKKTKRENEYGINTTFLAGHFKAFTIKLNPLDGVYYCDIRPNMRTNPLLSQQIKTIDHFFYSDLWELLNRQGQSLEEIAITDEESGST